MDIVIIGRIAENAALATFSAHRAEILGRYPNNYLLKGVQSLEAEFAPEDFLKKALQMSVYMNVISGGSLEEGLWQLGEELNCGLRVKRDELPINQFAVEMAEIDGRDPIKSDSTGCVLCVTDKAGELCDEAAAAGIPCKPVGYITDDKDRCLVSERGKTFLTGRKE